MQQPNGNIYLCRRCEPPMEIRDYTNLRAHLRAVHRIKQVLNSDIALYEAFPGSRFLQPPFQGTENSGSEVDEMILIRNEMVRVVSRTAAENTSAIQIPAPIVNIDIDEILRVLGGLKRDLERTIQISVQHSVKQNLTELSQRLKLSRMGNNDVSIDDLAKGSGTDAVKEGQSTAPAEVQGTFVSQIDHQSDESSDVSLIIDTSCDEKIEEPVNINISNITGWKFCSSLYSRFRLLSKIQSQLNILARSKRHTQPERDIASIDRHIETSNGANIQQDIPPKW